MPPLKNQFSWSKSRDGKFRTCPRQYFFHYYGIWGGWEPGADPRTRQIYMLKNLSNRSIWPGSKVHDAIKNILNTLRQGYKPISEQEALDQLLNEMRQEYLKSKRGDYRTINKSFGLFEHEYQVDISRAEWKATADHALHCLRTFLHSKTYRDIQNISHKNWLEIEEFSTFLLDDVTVHAVPDFSYRDGNDIVIYDWKTGKSPSRDVELQLACYSLYAVQKWRVEPQQVRTIEFNLARDELIKHHQSGIDLPGIQQRIRASIAEMRSCLTDATENIASEEQFDCTKDEHPCKSCNYKKVCPRWA